MNTDKVREKIKDIVKQSYINGYNAHCNGEVWEHEDGSVTLPSRSILIDTLIILAIPELHIETEDQEISRGLAWSSIMPTKLRTSIKYMLDYFKSEGFIKCEPKEKSD